MATNPYLTYYTNQAGNGIGSFDGIRYQRGKGVFGSIIKSAIFPLIKYLTPRALKTGMEVVSDLTEGQPVIQSLKKRSSQNLRDIAGDVSDRAKTFSQTGRGKRIRKKPFKSFKNINKKNKRKKNSKTSKKIDSIFI